MMMMTMTGASASAIASLLLVAAGTTPPALSFPVIPRPSLETALRYAGRAEEAETAGCVATDFWGEPRSEGELIDFASDAVFGGGGAARRREGGRRVEVLSAEPPVLLIHGFLKRGHCDRIIESALEPTSSSSTVPDGNHVLKRSTTGNEQEESDHRTSSTAWLREGRCPLPLRMFASRASRLSGMPTGCMENLQVVRYLPGEEFRLHTDHLDSFNDFDCGGRLCTCLVYLNDSEQAMMEAPQANAADHTVEGGGAVEGFTGGETAFPEFDAKVIPRKGSALFFWNTIERPGSKEYSPDTFLNVDARSRHAGLPVLSGEKWVANRWIHPRNFGAGVRGL